MKKMLKQSVKNKSSRLIRTNVKLFICSLSVRVVEYHLRSLLEPLRSNRSIQIQCKQDNRVHNWNFDTKTAIGIFFSGPMLPPLCFFIIAAKNSNGIFSLRPQNINIHINALQHISDEFFSGQTYSKFYIFTVLSQTIHGGISQWTCINFSNYISLIFFAFFWFITRHAIKITVCQLIDSPSKSNQLYDLCIICECVLEHHEDKILTQIEIEQYKSSGYRGAYYFCEVLAMERLIFMGRLPKMNSDQSKKNELKIDLGQQQQQ